MFILTPTTDGGLLSSMHKGRKVTVAIYKDAQCTQLANMNSATENWLQLSSYPNYTEVVRNGGANVLPQTR